MINSYFNIKKVDTNIFIKLYDDWNRIIEQLSSKIEKKKKVFHWDRVKIRKAKNKTFNSFSLKIINKIFSKFNMSAQDREKFLALKQRNKELEIQMENFNEVIA